MPGWKYHCVPLPTWIFWASLWIWWEKGFGRFASQDGLKLSNFVINYVLILNSLSWHTQGSMHDFSTHSNSYFIYISIMDLIMDWLVQGYLIFFIDELGSDLSLFNTSPLKQDCSGLERYHTSYPFKFYCLPLFNDLRWFHVDPISAVLPKLLTDISICEHGQNCFYITAQPMFWFLQSHSLAYDHWKHQEPS